MSSVLKLTGTGPSAVPSSNQEQSFLDAQKGKADLQLTALRETHKIEQAEWAELELDLWKGNKGPRYISSPWFGRY